MHRAGYPQQGATRPTCLAEETMMDQIFDWCVNVLLYWAGILGMTYEEINVWVFVILWPILTVVLIGIIVVQRRRILQLLKE